MVGSRKEWLFVVSADIRVFDTTLRDGEQTADVNFPPQEKLEIALALEKLNVQVIEAGFPVAAPSELEAVHLISEQVRNTIVCALARCLKKDIEKAWDGISKAAQPRLHVFIGTSPIHRDVKLGLTKEQVIEKVQEAVTFARSLCPDVQFSPEDASRTELDFLKDVVQTAVDAGASTINIPDTLGCCIPEEFAAIFNHLQESVQGIDTVVLGAHCHNDLGLAVANTLAAIKAGARHVECTINGIGERAGNCALEELVVALRHKRDYYAVDSSIHTEQLLGVSQLVEKLADCPVQANKAVVGKNAFSHTSGIHQHGVIKDRTTYEILNPPEIGFTDSYLPLGKLSGSAALKQFLDKQNLSFSEDQFHKFFSKYKNWVDAKKHVTPEEITKFAHAFTKTS